MNPIFETTASSKFVLAGEHAVLRGYGAVALPYENASLTFKAEFSQSPVVFEPPALGPIFQSMFQDLTRYFEKTRFAKALQDTFAKLGVMACDSHIPLGAGLGSSAALSVALSRLLMHVIDFEGTVSVVELATFLEQRFHGKSSGMDVAIIEANQPIWFERARGAVPLESKALPHFELIDTGLRMRTSDAVSHVESLIAKDPAWGERQDSMMGHASILAKEGLKAWQEGKGLKLLAHAMEQAHLVFDQWGLVPEIVHEMRRDLAKRGALASKLTGAGGGGMLVALWPDRV